MNAATWTIGRLAVVAAVAALVGVGTVGSAEAAINKAAFKQGCEQGGGSYIENNDGTFQCNVSGGTIKCFPNDTCVFIPSSAVIDDGGNGGLPVNDGGHLGGAGPLDGVLEVIDEGTESETPVVSQLVVSQPVVSQPDDDQEQDTNKSKKSKKGKKGGKGRKK